MSEQGKRRWRELVGLAWEIALRAHVDQVDKNGEPYLGHVGRVMARMRPNDAAAIIVALLHDVVEDSGGLFTLQCLEDQYGFPPRVIAALDAISHRKGLETHAQYIERCRRDTLARTVKRADLLDNLDERRRYKGDEGLRERYTKALRRMEQPIPKSPLVQSLGTELSAWTPTTIPAAWAAAAAIAGAALSSGPMDEPDIDGAPF